MAEEAEVEVEEAPATKAIADAPESADPAGGGNLAAPTATRRGSKKTDLILITGAARSGTSLVSMIIAGLGARLGEPHDINVLWENVAIREHVLKKHLRSIGCDPVGQRLPFPETSTIGPDPSIKREFDRRLPKGRDPRVYKDAKLGLAWPAWADAFPDARWVIVRRDVERIVDSCLRTKFMRAYQTRDGWRRWVHEHERRFDEMKDAGLNIIEVWPKDFVRKPAAFEPVAEFCGLTFDPAVVTAAVNPRLFLG